MKPVAIIKAPPRALVLGSTVAEVRSELATSRARLAQEIQAIHHSLHPLSSWRVVFQRHPLITLGAAFVAGYGLARLLSRK